jgi:LuxR family maltose regulon positive regulatory protein
MINEAEDIVRQNKIVLSIITIYVAIKGIILIQQNELKRARHFFKEIGLGLDKKISYSDEHGYVGYALLLVIELRFGEAEILLAKLLKMAQVANRVERIIEVKIIYAILNKATGNQEKALINLIDALEEAASENILMSFILFYSRIDDLLKEVYKVQTTTKSKIPKKVIDKLKSAIEKREKYDKTRFESPLNKREIDALKLIAEDLSNQEVADKLFISINTVKTHLKNIFLKLEVDKRSGAVAKAKELGLL